jgi:PAS domain S-box-containing protein
MAPKLWRSLAVASLIPIVLAGLAIWFGSEYERAARNSADIRLAYRQQLAIATLISRMKDAETGQRGYVITGDPAFLAPYQVARADVPKRLDTLAHVLEQGGNTDAAQVRQLNALVAAKFAELDRAIRVRDTQGEAAAARIVAAGHGRRLMDQIRERVAALYAEKNQTLTSSLAREDRRTQIIQLASWIIVGLVCVLALEAAYFIWHSRNARFIAQRQFAESTARQTAIFQNSLDAIILINPSGGIEILNPAAERLFGYPPTDLERRDISLIVNLAPGAGTFLERLGVHEGMIAEPFRTPLEARRRDGERVSVEVALATMALDDGMHIVAAFRDISDRAKIERMKDEFLSTVSHELRTPLTSIIGSLSLIRAGVTGAIPPETERLVVIAENNANRLIRLVNDLLDIEKLQAEGMRFDFETMDLRRTCEDAAEAVRGLATGHRTTLDIDMPDTPVTVSGDTGRLTQVVTNLLSNAVRFSPAGSEVTVKVAAHAGTARLSVIDHGPGIDAELRGRLFTRFAQSRQITASTPGTGLGLAISQEIVRNHGGSIWWEETPGGGSTFVFTLPLTCQANGAHAADATRLLFYAGQDDAAGLSRAFDAQSIATDIVADAQAAIEALRTRSYLALVVDFQFANGAALPLIETIRADPALRTLPIIAIAEHEADATAADIAALDIIDWIPRPISGPRIEQAVSASVRRANANTPLILHVDDDNDTLEITSMALGGVARIARARDVASARAFLAHNPVDVIIIDLALPDGSGLEILEHEEGSAHYTTPVIIYSAQDGSDTPPARNVRAVLTKSKRSLPNLVETVAGLIDRQREGGTS